MYSSPIDNVVGKVGSNVPARRGGIFLLVFIGSLLGFARSGLGDEAGLPSRIVVEESLVWRTRIYPRKVSDWSPIGISFGAGKPSNFLIEATGGFPFLKESQRPTVVERAKAGWSTHGTFQFEEQSPFLEKTSDAPQFGLKVVSDHSGLRLTRPTFSLAPALLNEPLVNRAAWMPDSVEFRFERGSGDMAGFSLRNSDPHHVVTFHNLRYAVDSNEVELSDRILLDQTVPLAHPFTDGRQAESPPVVLPKAGFATFQVRFPMVPLPLILVPGSDSREFSLGELTLGRWIFVEGFATRTDREGRPILDDRGLPEVPSEFRYGFRLSRRTWPKIDLTRYRSWSDDNLLANRLAGRRGSFAEQMPSTAIAPISGFPYGGYGSGGSSGGGAGGAGGSSGFGGSGGSGGNGAVAEPLPSSNGQTGFGTTIPPVSVDGTIGPLPFPNPIDPRLPTTSTEPEPPLDPVTPVSETPEPATWIGMILGALGLGIGLLRSRASQSA